MLCMSLLFRRNFLLLCANFLTCYVLLYVHMCFFNNFNDLLFYSRLLFGLLILCGWVFQDLIPIIFFSALPCLFCFALLFIDSNSK